MSELSQVRNVETARGPGVGLPPRGKARVHSVVVRVLRVVLPLTMVATVLGLVTLVTLHAVRRVDAIQNDASTPIEMINPHFFGRDSKGRPYTLSARQAARDPRSFQRVLLNYPAVTLDANGANPSRVTADTGVYHEESRLLYLKGHIVADNAKSSHFATDRAVVDTRTGAVTSPSALSSRTSAGDVQSKGFDVFDKGDRVVFKGGVHARLNQH
jgi:lipopolysaccharide export system protein LptC